MSENWRPSAEELAQARAISAEEVRNLLADDVAVQEALQGKYDVDLNQLAGQMLRYGEEQIRRAMNTRELVGGAERQGAHWMLKKMVAYVTGEQM